MKIKKEDKVRIISGAYKGVEGKVLKVFPNDNKVIVEKVNFIKKHQRPTQQNPSGGVIEMESPINVSNVLLICSKCGEPTKAKMKILKDKSRTRICSKCGDMI